MKDIETKPYGTGKGQAGRAVVHRQLGLSALPKDAEKTTSAPSRALAAPMANRDPLSQRGNLRPVSIGIPCSAADLGNLTVATHNRPSVEAIFALEFYRKENSKFLLPWRSKIFSRLSDFGLHDWLNHAKPTEDLFSIIAETRGGMKQSSQELTNLRHFGTLALGSSWSQISHSLKKAREETALRIATCGLDEVLNSLTSSLKWDGSAIHVASGTARTVRLNDRRIALYPSFFVSGAVVVNPMKDSAETVGVFFPYPMPECVVDTLNQGANGRVRSDVVATLVGRTRASALEVLTEPRSTSELANVLGVCQATASKHASTLRRAGLVTTNTVRNRRVHLLTARGAALLFGDLGGAHGSRRPTPLGRLRVRST